MILRNGPEFGTNVLILRTLCSSFSFSSGANGFLFHLLVTGSRTSQHTSFSKPRSQLLRFSTASLVSRDNSQLSVPPYHSSRR